MIRILPLNASADLLRNRGARLEEAESTVRPILEDVERRGDAALAEYARRFDNFTGASFAATADELTQATDRVTPQFRTAILKASVNIRGFAQHQLPKTHSAEIAPGITAGQIVIPLNTAVAYIPAGRYPLPSTLMMTTIPAQVAGVKQICVTSPRAVDEIDATAHLLGIHRVFRLGGSHAIAAFAFGTDTIPRADRIVGPGSIYVAAAKRLLAGRVGIDFVAGPTEILIIADEGSPQALASDMLAQAEHDVESSALLLTTSRKLAKEVETAINRHSAIILVDKLEQAVEFSNRFAPEHLSIYDESMIPSITCAGSIFIGPYSPEAAGDYASGPNHVLPTSGHARFRGGLSTADFVKVISVQHLTREGLASLAPTVTTLARAEGLEAHARSVECRL
jgi:histidinol dehydrogenase